LRKRLSYLTILLVAAISSCSKTGDGTLPAGLVGEWKFLYATGGFSGNDSIPADPAQVKLILFHENLTYEVKNNQQLTDQGTYELRSDTTIFSTDPLPVIVFKSENQFFEKVYDIKNSRLRLTDNHYEPYTSVFQKQQSQVK
jgi:hypothetical protein